MSSFEKGLKEQTSPPPPTGDDGENVLYDYSYLDKEEQEPELIKLDTCVLERENERKSSKRRWIAIEQGQRHPIFDKDGDGVVDKGFRGLFSFMDLLFGAIGLGSENPNPRKKPDEKLGTKFENRSEPKEPKQPKIKAPKKSKKIDLDIEIER